MLTSLTKRTAAPVSATGPLLDVVVVIRNPSTISVLSAPISGLHTPRMHTVDRNPKADFGTTKVSGSEASNSRGQPTCRTAERAQFEVNKLRKRLRRLVGQAIADFSM